MKRRWRVTLVECWIECDYAPFEIQGVNSRGRGNCHSCGCSNGRVHIRGHCNGWGNFMVVVVVIVVVLVMFVVVVRVVVVVMVIIKVVFDVQ